MRDRAEAGRWPLCDTGAGLHCTAECVAINSDTGASGAVTSPASILFPRAVHTAIGCAARHTGQRFGRVSLTSGCSTHLHGMYAGVLHSAMAVTRRARTNSTATQRASRRLPAALSSRTHAANGSRVTAARSDSSQRRSTRSTACYGSVSSQAGTATHIALRVRSTALHGQASGRCTAQRSSSQPAVCAHTHAHTHAQTHTHTLPQHCPPRHALLTSHTFPTSFHYHSTLLFLSLFLFLFPPLSSPPLRFPLSSHSLSVTYQHGRVQQLRPSGGARAGGRRSSVQRRARGPPCCRREGLGPPASRRGEELGPPASLRRQERGPPARQRGEAVSAERHTRGRSRRTAGVSDAMQRGVGRRVASSSSEAEVGVDVCVGEALYSSAAATRHTQADPACLPVTSHAMHYVWNDDLAETACTFVLGAPIWRTGD